MSRFAAAPLLLALIALLAPRLFAEDPKGQTPESPTYLVLICRETAGKIEVLSSRTVAGVLKPAYLKPDQAQIAELMDDKGCVLTTAGYTVVRERHWDAPKPGTNELEGGKVAVPNPVFIVRVPCSSKATTLRLARPRKAVMSTQATGKAQKVEFDELLRIPLSRLPREKGAAK